MTNYREEPVERAGDLVAAGYQLIDVREDDEWAGGSLPGAVHIPLGDVPDRLAEIDPARPVALLCRVGGRSGRAAEYLAGQGYSEVVNLTGGLLALGLA